MLFFSSLANAQTIEINAALKELEVGNYDKVIASLSSVESIISKASVNDKVTFYYLKGTALVATANKKTNIFENLSQAVVAFNNLIEVENKSNRYKYTSEAIESLKKIKGVLLNSAKEDFAIENFTDSSNKFYQAYLMDRTDTLQLYNAAVSYKKSNNNVLSLKCYEELKAINYSGNFMVYVAFSKDKLRDEYFGTVQERNAKIRNGSHARAREEYQSKKAEIYKNIAMFYVRSRNKEKAIKAISEARNLDNQNFSLALIEANLYLETKDYYRFDSLVSLIIEFKCNKAQLLTYFGENCHDEKYFEGAEYYYKKAIEIDPNYSKAYAGLLALMVEKSNKITAK